MTLSNHPQVVFATDFSDGAAAAADVAADYARHLGARLHVLHVTRHGWEDEMQIVLRQYVRRFDGLAVTAAVETGATAERIVQYALDQSADLASSAPAAGRASHAPCSAAWPSRWPAPRAVPC